MLGAGIEGRRYRPSRTRAQSAVRRRFVLHSTAGGAGVGTKLPNCGFAGHALLPDPTDDCPRVDQRATIEVDAGATVGTGPTDDGPRVDQRVSFGMDTSTAVAADNDAAVGQRSAIDERTVAASGPTALASDDRTAVGYRSQDKF
jgi:hypothetical protein